jgi:hypothetical protein
MMYRAPRLAADDDGAASPAPSDSIACSVCAERRQPVIYGKQSAAREQAYSGPALISPDATAWRPSNSGERSGHEELWTKSNRFAASEDIVRSRTTLPLPILHSYFTRFAEGRCQKCDKVKKNISDYDRTQAARRGPCDSASPSLFTHHLPCRTHVQSFPSLGHALRPNELPRLLPSSSSRPPAVPPSQ